MAKRVAVLMGSANDKEKVEPAAEILRRFGVEVVVEVISAHRNPSSVTAFAAKARENGYGAVICAAGMAAALPGAVAAHTTLPVIGLPLSGSALNGVDALYSAVQMPPGVPVACVAIDGAKNAGILAAQILAVDDEELAEKLAEFKAGGAK
ncbi:MAG: 5-(carboxyamino)imidazole ribonucleotide mutase [Actinomycetota bacterium]|nr:5-(carboxyamino)imidazole ribonucleotide mutase [Actinomycetota bacterium]